jgi:hypothetical protein
MTAIRIERSGEGLTGLPGGSTSDHRFPRIATPTDGRCSPRAGLLLVVTVSGACWALIAAAVFHFI